jgi:hypothetical protein
MLNGLWLGILLTVAVLLAGCAHNQPPPPLPPPGSMVSDPGQPTPARPVPPERFATALLGRWEVEIRNTPYGRLEGSMLVQETDDDRGVEAFLDVPMIGSAIVLQQFAFDGERLSFTAVATVDGQQIDLAGSGVVDADRVEGEIVVANFGTFPMTATRF